MTSAVVTGQVLRAVGGFYRIALADDTIVEARLSGRLRPGGAKDQQGPVLAGDQVILEHSSAMWLITDVMPRNTELRRPPIANVDLCVVVQSVRAPTPNMDMIDRILIQASHAGLDTMLCISKADLGDEESIAALLRPYEIAGYPHVITSAISGLGIDELARALKGRISTLAGASGVGKSRLLNAVCPDFNRAVGEISKRAVRGRHTTRQVELLKLPFGGWIADTPGFSTLSFGDMTLRELPATYPDFTRYAAQCRFASCLHRGEPGCAVQHAVEEGRIDSGRYQRYLRFAEEVEELEARRY
ncbi:MAG: ribosome small subunit-dependent GTPase A [Firmicutes bacterium]|nr:ribosome small subunit-dependent GTPase A [Bacillota bacterium]